MGFLQRFGYLEGRQDTNSEALIREEAVIDAIRTMQRFGGISPTGRMDNETLQVSNLFTDCKSDYWKRVFWSAAKAVGDTPLW